MYRLHWYQVLTFVSDEECALSIGPSFVGRLKGFGKGLKKGAAVTIIGDLVSREAVKRIREVTDELPKIQWPHGYH